MINKEEKDFLVIEGTPVYLDGRLVLSSTDFLVSFSGEELEHIESIRRKTKIIIENQEFYFAVSSKYGNVHINAFDLLNMQ